MSKISETEIKSMTKEQNYLRGYTDGKADVLDKIREEIEQGYCTVNNDYDHGHNYGLYMAIQIIDKYKTEMESRND